MSFLTTVREVGSRSLALRLGYEAQRRLGLLHHRMQANSGWPHWSVPNVIRPEYGSDWQDRLARSRRTLFCDQGTSARIRELLGESGASDLVARANRILAGELPYFGETWLQAGFPPSWFVSAIDGARVDPHRAWTSMGFHGSDYGDLKFILEPSRFLFVGELARAYLLTNDERYPSAFWEAIEDWASNSPPAIGPLWICGQESALRIVSWCLGWMAFRRASSTTRTREGKLLSLVAAHGWRIQQTRSYSKSQRSNHVISEAVGLLTASLVFPELVWANAWKKTAMSDLQEAVEDQFSADGTYAQQSLNYQRMALQLLAWSSALLCLHGESLPEPVVTRMRAARDFLLAVMEPKSGHVPNSGANDGSLVLPLDSCEYGDFRPTIHLISRIVGSESGLPPGPWEEPATLLLGTKSDLPEGNPTAKSCQGYRGFYILRSSESRAVLRCEDGQRRPYHADQLHLDIWWKGLNLARDPGTYMYNGEPPWDNGLASTAVHNTVLVDNTDQMERAGRFLWRRWAHGKILEHSLRTVCAEHDGYDRWGILHRRAIGDLAGRGWIIVDDLIGQGRHTASLNWLLPDMPAEICEGELFQLLLRTIEGNVEVICFSNLAGRGSLVRRGRRETVPAANGSCSWDQLRGWEASTYGRLHSATSVVFEVAGEMPARCCTLFLFAAHNNLSLDLNSHVSIAWKDSELVATMPSVEKQLTLSIECHSRSER